MFKTICFVLGVIAAILTMIQASAADDRTVLPNGWRLTPAGTLIRLPGDMPLRIEVAPDGKSMLIVTGGYHDHAIDVIDVDKASLRQHVPLGKVWAGLTVDRMEGTIYVSGGGPMTERLRKKIDTIEVKVGMPPEGDLQNLPSDVVEALSKPLLRLGWNADHLAFEKSGEIQGLAEADRYIAGLSTDANGHLFVVNFQNGMLYKLAVANGDLLSSVKLGYRPFQLSISPDGGTVAVANWGNKSVSLIDAASLKEKAWIEVGVHPTDLTYAPDGRLFVANASSNTVSVIRDGRVIEIISTSLLPGDPVGSTPNALAVSPDAGRLYVANADNNDVAVVDIRELGRARVLGFIPTGWYPSAVALTPDGKKLVVGVAKGIGSRANWPGQLGAEQVKEQGGKPFDYIGRVMTGYAEVIPVPDGNQLAEYTAQVRKNSPIGAREITASEQQAAKKAFHNIKHVIYVIRENRTYDHVLGDDPRGDGAKDLALFGQEITPNVHALVQQTPLLDRYFVNGEVSEDGHYWANSAYSTAYDERLTATMYGGRGTPGLPLPDMDQHLIKSPAGYLWEVARRAGLSYFSYGEFSDEPDGGALFTNDQDIEQHSSPNWGIDFDKTDVERAEMFARDFKAAERGGKWPDLTIVWFPWDHTIGLAPGKPTPQAMVADNDLALGKLVDAVSHSSFWASTAIFVTEDDAQGGPDHVDDHRSVALVISPYVKQRFIDHTPYTMTSMVRTMELILNLPPMSQYDRDATPMCRLFQATPTMWQYAAKPETVNLGALNPETGPLAKASMELDFSHVDRADPDQLNAILWAALKPGVPMPVPVHSATNLALK